MPPGRYILTCNQSRTDDSDRGGMPVAGGGIVPAPTPALHPTIGCAFAFGVWSVWYLERASRRRGTYHVIHPGGRNHEHFPVNALEAECKKVQPVWGSGHTQGQRITPPIMDGGDVFTPTANPVREAHPSRWSPIPSTLHAGFALRLIQSDYFSVRGWGLTGKGYLSVGRSGLVRDRLNHSAVSKWESALDVCDVGSIRVRYHMLAGVWRNDGRQRIVRPHWERFYDYYNRLTGPEIRRLALETERRLKNRGWITMFTMTLKECGAPGNWILCPWCCRRQTGRLLDKGCSKGPGSFSLLLSDLYGDQHCLREGGDSRRTHPSSPRFLPGFGGWCPLTFFATDLTCGPDGKWWVPSGSNTGTIGSGLCSQEARMISRRVLGPEPGEVPTLPLTPFFQHFKRQWRRWLRQSKWAYSWSNSQGIGNEVLFRARLSGFPSSALPWCREMTWLCDRVGVSENQMDDPNRWMSSSVVSMTVFVTRFTPTRLLFGVPRPAQAQMLGRSGRPTQGAGVMESPGFCPLPGVPVLSRLRIWSCPMSQPGGAGNLQECDYVMSKVRWSCDKKVDRTAQVIFGAQLTKAQKSELQAQIKAGALDVCRATADWIFNRTDIAEVASNPTPCFAHLLPVTGNIMSDARRADQVCPMPMLLCRSGGGQSKDTWCSPGKTVQRPAPAKGDRHRKHAAAVLNAVPGSGTFWMARPPWAELDPCWGSFEPTSNNSAIIATMAESDLEVLSGLKPVWSLLLDGKNRLVHVLITGQGVRLRQCYLFVWNVAAKTGLRDIVSVE